MKSHHLYKSIHARILDTVNLCFSNCGAAAHWWSMKYYEKWAVFFHDMFKKIQFLLKLNIGLNHCIMIFC
jgi:hypothetical protein